MATFGPASGGGKIATEGMGSTEGSLLISNPTGSNSFNCFRVISQGTNRVVFTQGGSATFSGNVSAPNITNTFAALLRLKAALLIPDQDVNQLRARLLEALENITEEVN